MSLPSTGARVLAAACALTFLAAACSDDDGADDAATTETTAADASTTAADSSTVDPSPDDSSTTEADAPASGRDPAEAAAIVEAINLTLDDFADGWSATERPADVEEGDELDSCFREVDVEASAIVEGETPQFSVEVGEGDGQVVNMQTVVFDSVETAEAAMAETATNQFSGCAEDLFLRSFNEGGGDVSVDLEQSADDPALTDESVGITGALVGTMADGTVIDGRVDLHVFRTADVVSSTLVVDFGDVAFEDTLEGLYAEIASRHAAEVS